MDFFGFSPLPVSVIFPAQQDNLELLQVPAFAQKAIEAIRSEKSLNLRIKRLQIVLDRINRMIDTDMTRKLNGTIRAYSAFDELYCRATRIKQILQAALDNLTVDKYAEDNKIINKPNEKTSIEEKKVKTTPPSKSDLFELTSISVPTPIKADTSSLPVLMNKKQLAKYIGFSTSWVDHNYATCGLKYSLIGRLPRFLKKNVDEFIEQGGLKMAKEIDASTCEADAGTVAESNVEGEKQLTLKINNRQITVATRTPDPVDNCVSSKSTKEHHYVFIIKLLKSFIDILRDNKYLDDDMAEYMVNVFSSETKQNQVKKIIWKKERQSLVTFVYLMYYLNVIDREQSSTTKRDAIKFSFITGDLDPERKEKERTRLEFMPLIQNYFEIENSNAALNGGAVSKDWKAIDSAIVKYAQKLINHHDVKNISVRYDAIHFYANDRSIAKPNAKAIHIATLDLVCNNL
jgi:hypothetical protein